jgi:predicted dinucleotide-binding enzyme
MNSNRRIFLLGTGAATGLALAGLPLASLAAGTKIGMIGAGRVGSTVGELWAKAGHEVMFSSLDLEKDKALAAQIGLGTKAGTSREAAAFGEVLFFSVPYSAIPVLGRDLADSLKGKVVLDASNPIPARDGEIAATAKARGGSGIASAEYLAGARVVRAFNCVGYTAMKSEAHRAGEKLGIPIAGDDAEAVKMATRLVTEAGFEAVMVGGLASAKEFDWGTPIFGKPNTAAGVRQVLGLKS